MKSGKRPDNISLLLVLLTVAVSIVAYPFLPHRVAVHWNINGVANGYASKLTDILVIPVISTLIYLLFKYIPRIDPESAGLQKHHSRISWASVLVLGFLFYVRLLTIVINLGYAVDMARMLAPFFAVLIAGMGFVMEDIPKNYFIGIRTPWTLASDKVWVKTHRLAARWFKIIGVIMFGGIFFPGLFLFLTIAALVVFSLYLFWYSYRQFRK